MCFFYFFVKKNYHHLWIWQCPCKFSNCLLVCFKKLLLNLILGLHPEHSFSCRPCNNKINGKIYYIVLYSRLLTVTTKFIVENEKK